MSTKGERRNKNLKFRKAGIWREIVDVSKDISSVLNSLDLDDLKNKISEKDLKRVNREWEDWRPRRQENFSEEMRTKTAKQCSVNRSELEKEGKESSEKIKVAENSLKSATEEIKDKSFDAAKNQLLNGVKNVSKAVDCEVRKGIRSFEENVYENVILRTNSLYFDNSILNVVLSKNVYSNSEEKYQLDLYSNNPLMRRIFAERIDWDGN